MVSIPGVSISRAAAAAVAVVYCAVQVHYEQTVRTVRLCRELAAERAGEDLVLVLRRAQHHIRHVAAAYGRMHNARHVVGCRIMLMTAAS